MTKKTIMAVGLGLVVAGFLVGGVQGCGSSSSGTLSPADQQAICGKVCDKFITCTPAASAVAGAADLCKAGCASGTMSGMGVSNQVSKCAIDSAAASKANACLAQACDTYMACLDNICPADNTGTGGTSGAGSGGTVGGNGTGGTAGLPGTGGASATTGTGGASATNGTGGAGSEADAGTGGITAGGSGGSGTDAGVAAGCEMCAKEDQCCAAIITAAGGQPGEACMLAAACSRADPSTIAAVNMGCMVALQSAATMANAPAACK